MENESALNTKKEVKLTTTTSKNKTWIETRERCGGKLLSVKETHETNGFFVVHIHQVVCQKCSHVIRLPKTKTIYEMLGRIVSYGETCPICDNNNICKYT